MRRWLTRLLLAFILLAALALIAAQLVLRSDLPRRLVIQMAETQTGLHIDAASLDTGWLGRTTIHDLSVSLPMETQPLLTMPELRVEHAGLLKLLLTRDPAIKSIAAREPFIQLHETSRGGWNLIEAAEQVIARQSGGDTSTRADTEIPKVDITGGVIELTTPDGRLRRYTDVTLRGEPDRRGVWRGEAELAPHLNVNAALSSGGSWAHDIRFDLQQISDVIKPWLPDVPDRLHATGRWQGNVQNGTLAGRLVLDDLAVDRVTARGELDGSVQGTTATVSPRDVSITLTDSPVDAISLTGGHVRSNGRLSTIDQLIVDAAGVQARIDGRWSRDDERGSVLARWTGSLGDGTTTHRGSLDVRAMMQGVVPVQLTLDAHSEGAGELGAWAMRLEAEARAEHWTSMSGSILASELSWSGDAHSVDLSGLTSTIEIDWPLARIGELHALDDVVNAHGRFDARSRDWSIALAASDWYPSRRVQYPALATVEDHLAPIQLNLAASGRGLQVALERLELLAADLAMRANGSYTPSERAPLKLQMAIEAPLERLDLPGLTGRMSTEARITGSVVGSAFDLQGDGTTTVQDAQWRERGIGTVVVPWRSELRDQQIDLATETFALLDGQWAANGHYDFDTERAVLTLQSTGAAIDRVVTLLDAPIELGGMLDLDTSLEMTRFDQDTLAVEGRWRIRELTAPMLGAADGRGEIQVRDGIVQLHEVTIGAEDQQLVGEASFSLDQPAIVDVSARSINWPLTIAETGLTIIIAGAIDGQADLEQSELRGGFDAHADVVLSDRPLGWAELRGDLDAMAATITEFYAELLDGTITGGGRIALDPAQWTQSTAHLDWANLDLAQVAAKLDRPDLQLESLTGRMHGRLAAGPATDRRAPEPWQFDLSGTFEDASFGAITLGRAPATSELDDDEEHMSGESAPAIASKPDAMIRGYAGAKRVLLDAAQLALADGLIDLWGRVSVHDDELAAHLHAELRDLDLQPFALVAGFDDRPMPGRLNGSASAGGSLQPPHRLFGGARLSLRESDLAALPFISILFDTLRLSFSEPEPTGAGEAVIRLEGNRVELSRLSYFNRGTDIVAQMSVEDFTRGAESPVRGVAAGGVRPLRDIELPFFDQLDRAVGALQSNAASVRIEGTVGALETRVVPLSEIFGTIGRVLGGN